jgi:hypothetical protein
MAAQYMKCHAMRYPGNQGNQGKQGRKGCDRNVAATQHHSPHFVYWACLDCRR